MRDNDEVPYIVIETGGGGGGVGSFVLGALVGAGLALLFTPKTGAETQKELKQQARRLRETAEESVRGVQAQLEERLGEAREGVASRYDEVRDAVSAGRSAASDAREELEEKLQRSKIKYRAGVAAAREAVAAGLDEPED